MRHVNAKWSAFGAGALGLLLAFCADGKAQPLREEGARTVRGTVKNFTSAPKGEIDGLVLNDGTVIHWPPHLEARFKAIVAKGDRVEVIGRRETGPEGDTKIEVRRVTNLRTGAARTNEDVPAPPPALERRGGDRGGTTEERLRALEDKLDRLTEEIRRLKRDE
jgi:hypothetical protein